ncbi:3-hydroxyacyl-CoA dehydrogenase/enoyl-CoA hydratase family protein [Natrononativus amylolyticus]|uniref:3-hydroxyacyl-CoA dehydrogenase/enoyl-CoA hydratase family protein n=1 Tax=Natrononativus amylolyticus TaxID=2963434 RepID=UPI0020CDCC7A|nr:3-hydroxyacyl-CoA dehydrogenase/enoyl-CoA hydratase family protein [Natrononativus amylolyticus]
MELEDINTVAVLGAGNMGHGIAEVAALAGYDVTMRDIKEEFVQDGYDQIEWSLGKLAENDQITEEKADDTLARITPLVDMEEAVGDADFVIEAVPEKMEIKKDVYGELEEHAPDRAIFATNTSSLSITELSEVTERPERFCGMHFFNPPIRMPLVEVITGEHTDEGVLELTEALADDFGKSPVRVHRDAPGFIVNRVLVPLMNEASWLVSNDEATIAEVDSTTKFDMGLPMGAFELGDQVGNDVSLHVLEYLHEVLGEAYEPAPLLVKKVENEELGKKTGKGFYDYEDGDGAEVPSDEGSEFVKERLLAATANEAAKLIGGDVAPPESIDEAVMLGGGWPEGPVALADDHGLESLLEVLEEAHEETGHARYEPDEYLRERAEAGGFYDADSDNGDGERFDYDVISVEIDDSVGHLEIDRAHRMNTITTDMIEEVDDAIDKLVEDDEVRALLVTGAGDRAFSAGFDASTASVANGLQAAEMSRLGQRVFGRLEEIPMPVLAAIDGYCLGGGMEFATCADMRISSRRSKFGQPEHNLGLLPGWGGTQRLSRIVGEGRAKEIIFTARNDYDPETMADYGFVNEVVDNDEFEDRAWELARDLAAGPPIAQEFTKKTMLAGRTDLEAGLELEASSFGHLFTTDDLWEGLAAFQQDREPEFEGK